MKRPDRKDQGPLRALPDTRSIVVDQLAFLVAKQLLRQQAAEQAVQAIPNCSPSSHGTRRTKRRS